jgi:hypothetical protein
MNRAIKVANMLLPYGFLVFGIIKIFFNIGNSSSMYFAFGSFIASWTAMILLKHFKINKNYIIFINVALWLNLIGEWFIYYGIADYDKILHLSNGILITAIAYEYFLKNFKAKKEFIFLTALGIFAIWEIYEYFLAILFNYPVEGVIVNGKEIMSRIDDTMWDMIWGSIGSIVYLFFKRETSNIKTRKMKN